MNASTDLCCGVGVLRLPASLCLKHPFEDLRIERVPDGVLDLLGAALACGPEKMGDLIQIAFGMLEPSQPNTDLACRPGLRQRPAAA